MVKFINRITHTVMYVEDGRKDEYIKAGHKLVEDKPKPVETKKPVAKKRTTRKK